MRASSVQFRGRDSLTETFHSRFGQKKKPRGGIYIRMSPPEEFVCNCEITE